jgi:hypothetical protein
MCNTDCGAATCVSYKKSSVNNSWRCRQDDYLEHYTSLQPSSLLYHHTPLYYLTFHTVSHLRP